MRHILTWGPGLFALLIAPGFAAGQYPAPPPTPSYPPLQNPYPGYGQPPAYGQPNAQLVESWYRKYLGRPADQYSLDTYTALLNSGTAPEEIQANLLASPEYYQKHGSRPWLFVQSMFQDVLGRRPTAQEMDYWTQRARELAATVPQLPNTNGYREMALGLLQAARTGQVPPAGGYYNTLPYYSRPPY
jgi:hypothetical protein